jgi:hypothetical protein
MGEVLNRAMKIPAKTAGLNNFDFTVRLLENPVIQTGFMSENFPSRLERSRRFAKTENKSTAHDPFHSEFPARGSVRILTLVPPRHNQITAIGAIAEPWTR